MKSSLRRYSAALFCLCALASRASAGLVDDVSQAKADDAVQEKRLADGIAVMKSGDPAGAMRDYFDKMIASNDQRIAAAGKNFELSAAWRGIGYVYVEQHRLADAEQMYLKCLELDANDKKAANELTYVRARQQREGTR